MSHSKPKVEKRQLWPKTLATTPNYSACACLLDRLADMELQHGHHHRAEQLAQRAAELREGAR